MKIGVIYKEEDRRIARAGKKIIRWLEKQGHKVAIKGASFVIAAGGDGTILRATRKTAPLGLPLLGVHMGGVGFLSEIEPAKLKSAIEKIKNKKFYIDKRMMIEARVRGRIMRALNDIVICKSGIARLIRLSVAGIGTYKADGLIVSTASGSTAYNLSAGGPILPPHARKLIVTAICHHSLKRGSKVLSGPVKIRLLKGKDVVLTGDGQEMVALKEKDFIIVKRSKIAAKFIRFKKYNVFKRLREKLV